MKFQLYISGILATNASREASQCFHLMVCQTVSLRLYKAQSFRLPSARRLIVSIYRHEDCQTMAISVP
ncbi:hypothetical protein ABG067_003609 [Albugo candida]